MDLSGQIFKATLQAKNPAEGVAKRPNSVFFSQPLSLPRLNPHLGVLQAALPKRCPDAAGPSHPPGTARFSLKQASHSLFHGDTQPSVIPDHLFSYFLHAVFFQWPPSPCLGCSPGQPLPQASLGRGGRAAQP